MTGSIRQRAAVLLPVIIVSATVLAAGQRSSTRPYFPPQGEWQKKDPAAVGLDKARIEEAIAFVRAHENQDTKDLSVAIVNQFQSESPYNTLIGPTLPRAASNGLIIRHGAVVAEWGDTARADMTFSVTKTFLSTVVGLAFDRGKIRSVTDRVASYMPASVDLFTSEQVRRLGGN